jgi:hypothetical protein
MDIEGRCAMESRSSCLYCQCSPGSVCVERRLGDDMVEGRNEDGVES